MMDPGTAIMIGGSAVSAMASLQSSEKQAEGLQQQADSLRRQSAFTAEGEKWTSQLAAREAGQRVDSQVGGYAAAGLEIKGSALDVIEQTMASAHEQIDASRKESLFRQDQLNRSANNYDSQADNTRSMGMLNAFGSILGAGGKAAQLSDTNSGSTMKLTNPTKTAGQGYLTTGNLA